MARKILFDCDTGGDDATAIALGVASSRLEVLGVTTCMGNQNLSQTLQNTLELITFLDVPVPVAKGSADPLLRKRWVGDDKGHRLSIPGLSEKTIDPSPLDAVEFMADMLLKSDEKVTLIPLAPLTNIAKLMMFYPDIVREKVDEIIVMGGGMFSGNTTGAAELNFYADPEAASTVFEFGLPVIMCGLDVCDKGYITPKDNEDFKDLQGKPAQVFYNITKNSFEWGGKKFDRTLMFDSIPVIYALHPEIFTTVKSEIHIECNSELCDGMSVCDFRQGFNRTTEGRIHTLVLDVDRQAYLRIVKEILEEGK